MEKVTCHYDKYVQSLYASINTKKCSNDLFLSAVDRATGRHLVRENLRFKFNYHLNVVNESGRGITCRILWATPRAYFRTKHNAVSVTVGLLV